MRKASSRSNLLAVIFAALGVWPLAPLSAQTVQVVNAAPIAAAPGAAAAGVSAGATLSLPMSPAATFVGGPSLFAAPAPALTEGAKAAWSGLPAAAAQAWARPAIAAADAAEASAAAARPVLAENVARSAVEAAVSAKAGAARAGTPSVKSLAAGVSVSNKAAAPERTAETGVGELSAFYDGSPIFRPGAEAVGAGAFSQQTRQGLERAPAASAASRAEPGTPAAPAPRSSLGRTFKVGYIGAILMLFVSEVVPQAASAIFHYVPHPSYQGPAMASPTAWAAIALMLVISVLAPISEEAIFRGGLMRWLRAKFDGLAGELGSFWIPALITSVVFTVLHETSDPLLIAVRVLGAMILARVYYKEGVLASMVTHGFFNGILGAVMLAGVFSLPIGGAVALATAAVGGLVWAARGLWRERADRASGAVVPVGMTPAIARVLAVVLVAGTVLAALWGGFELAIGGAVLWIPAAWGLRRWARSHGAQSERVPNGTGISA